MSKQMLSEHFSRAELVCHCCNRIGNDPVSLKKLLKHLEQLRKLAGNMPINITSAYRCPKHNAEIGGVPNSYHCQNMAVDLWIPGKSLNQIASLARSAGFTGIGKYWNAGFVHCDIGHTRTWNEGEGIEV
jgi:uncharacterized protein YcbK (DUF882 family)